jgi:hypothetical protein
MRPNWRHLHKLRGKSFLKFDPRVLGIRSARTYDNHEFLTSYNNLPIDRYVEDNDPPKRFRRYMRYEVNTEKHDKYSIVPSDERTFSQNVLDYRGKPRTFELIEPMNVGNLWLTDFLTQVSALAIINECIKDDVCVLESKIKSLTLDVHQVRQVAYPGYESHNSPEGIHRDGADYIVSALVINRINIRGGDSIIYNKDKNEIYRTTLREDEGIFQEDREQWHHVSGIVPTNNYLGFRDILGVDIIVNE